MTEVLQPLNFGGEKGWGSEASSLGGIEAAGRAYWSYLATCKAVDRKAIQNVSALSEVVGEDTEDDSGTFTVDFVVREDLTPDSVLDLTYYQILGFDEFGLGVNDDALKKAYRRAVLLYHPDKTGSEKGHEDEVFMAVQRAYDTLTDPVKKKQYESSMEFDESIPGVEASKGKDFFKVYGPVFARNERFAVILPAPKLGDANTDINEVFKFYEYWVNFESWRDFTLQCEHDLEEAEDRYHKRWMMKENDKKNKEMKRKEYKRLSQLVDQARAADPRIKQFEEDRREAKRALKQKRQDQKKEQEEAAVREKEEAEEAKRVAEESRKMEAKEARAIKDAHKKVLRNLRKKIKAHIAVAEAVEGSIQVSATEDFDWFLRDAELEVLQSCLTELGGAAEGAETRAEGMEVVQSLMSRTKEEQTEMLKESAAAKEDALMMLREAEKVAEEERKAAKNTVWTDQEMSKLSKAVTKFPPGAQNRWENIAQWVSQQLRLENPKTKEECIAKHQEMGQNAKKKAPSHALGGGAPPSSSPATVSSSSPDPTAAKEDAALVWTHEQQQALEKALKKFPPTLDKNERWNSISEAVEGKSKKDCVARFKEIKAILAAKKAAATGGAAAATPAAN